MWLSSKDSAEAVAANPSKNRNNGTDNTSESSIRCKTTWWFQWQYFDENTKNNQHH